ncbi:hypothetical protein B0T10DRAFT_474844 [Thelonectria olida]|uniref:BZIP domain-containing protein n=1 Tax=Thelonectria olida TaxID=1576542 RepID=A0A9P8WE62_9HYPO|nr:hypothetical protein B0T10DRAFT_474844 [Thelonectria olida]
MSQVRLPFSGLDKDVDGQTAVAAQGAGWNPYHVDVSYLLYNHWAGLDWSQLPGADYQHDFPPHGIETHAPFLNDSGIASCIDPIADQPEQFDPASCSQSYTTGLQSLDRENPASLPSDVSPSSFGEPEYDEHDSHKAIEPLPSRPSKQGPSTKRSRRKSTVEDDPNQSDDEQTNPSRGSKSNSRPTNKLERNRLAANRCRIRKRAETETLKSDKLKMEKQHTKLAGEVEELTDEVYQLKRQLFLHADCNCTLIQEYIKNGFRSDGGQPLPRCT